MGKNGNYPAFDYSHIYSFVMGYLIDLLIIKKASPRCAKMLPVIRMGLEPMTPTLKVLCSTS